MPRQRLRKTYGKRARLLTATAFLIFQGRVRKGGEGASETVSRTGYKVDLNYSKNAIVICKMCSELRRNARQGKARQGEGKARGGAMKTSDDDEGNSSCDSRRKIMFYLWVAQLPLLLMLLSLLPCFHPALLFYPFAVRPLCWAQLKIGLNDNSQFAIFCKFSTAECVIYAADIADFFWHNIMFV